MIMKNIIYFIIFLFSLVFINCNHGDNCLDAAKDYGTIETYDLTKKIFDSYKGKKVLVLKNEKGDTLNLGIKYSVIVKNDTIGNTLKNGKICTAEVTHWKTIELDLFYKDSIYYLSYLRPITDFDYSTKKYTKKYDEISGGWINKQKEGQSLFIHNIYDPLFNKISHKTVVIHGKNTEVIDAAEISPEQVFIHEDKGIVAMIIPNHGTGYWVVDKIE